MAAQYPNRSFFSVASAPGTGAITAGTALPAYQLPYQNTPPFTSGSKLPYVAVDGSNFEIGWGIYTNSAGTGASGGTETITRNLRGSTTGALLNLSASAQVMIAPSMQDQITFGNASNGDGQEHVLKMGWALGADGVYRLTFDLDNATTIGSLATYADLVAQLALITALQVRSVANEREIAVLELLRSVSSVALSAVGFLDDYADASGVDTANTTNASLPNAYSQPSSYADPYPDQTTSPTGYFAFASSAYNGSAPSTVSSGSYAPGSAFPGTPGSGGGWAAQGSQGATVQYLGRKLNAAAALASYAIGWQSNTRYATNWQFQGSNDTTTGTDGTWTTLDTQSGFVYSSTAIVQFNIATSKIASYKAYRLYFPANSLVSGGDLLQINAVRFYPAGSTGTNISNTVYVNTPWTPAALGSALAAWYDANDTANMTLVSGKVSQLNDKSGNANHLTQATDANRPTFSSTGRNNKPAILFNPATSTTAPQFLNKASMAGMSSGSGAAFTLACVANSTNTSGTFQYALSIGPGGADTTPYIASSGGNVYAGRWADNLSSSVSFSSTDDIVVYSNPANQTNAGATFDINGSAIAGTQGGTAAQVNIPASPPIELGAGYDGSSPYSIQNGWIGDIQEVVVVNRALTSTEISQLEGYFASKWGLQANLPTSHTYKSSAPGTTTQTPAAMSLRSVRATLKYTPSRVYYYGTAKMSGGAVNTDLKASVTRDGATYTAGTLVQLFTKADGTSIYELQDGSGKPGVDVTGQPSGQTVGYKVDTTAAYRQDLYNADLRAA